MVCLSAEPSRELCRLPARMSVAEGHGVNGSTSVSKTESLGSNPSAPAKQSLLDPEGSWIEPDGINALRRWWFYRGLARTVCH